MSKAMCSAMQQLNRKLTSGHGICLAGAGPERFSPFHTFAFLAPGSAMID
jgi:hypothetical protein